MNRKLLPLAVALTVLAVAPIASAAPANDDIGNAIDIGSLPFTDIRSTQGATTQAGEPEPCGGMQRTVWYRFTPSTDGVIVAHTSGSTFNTVLALYREEGAFGVDLEACNDNGGDGSTSRIRVPLIAGTTYLIQAGGGYYDPTGTIHLTVTRIGSLAGTVYDAVNGAPVEDMCVAAWHAGSKKKITDTLTDSDGEWTLPDLASGPVKLRYRDCGEDLNAPGRRDRNMYRIRWYANHASWLSAVPVGVPAGGTLAGIDVSLPRRPRPDLSVTALEIADESLEVGVVGEGPATGTSRTVTVSATNTGAETPGWSRIEVDICPRSIGSCKSLGRRTITLAPGASSAVTFFWNAADMVGDVFVTALANTDDDSDWENNVEEIRHYVHAGGTGFGVGPPCGDSPWVLLPLICDL